MQFTNEEEEDRTLPEDSIHRARLEEIKLRTFTWTDRRTGDEKEGKSLDWWWSITVPGSGLDASYVGRRVKGECNAKMSSREGNKFREWAEVLLGREIPIGMSVDTDDLVGLEAEIVIGHRQDKKDTSKTWEFVSAISPVEQRFSEDPPF